MPNRHYKIARPKNFETWKTSTELIRWHRSANGKKEYPRCGRLDWRKFKVIINKGLIVPTKVRGRKWWPPETSAAINRHYLNQQMKVDQLTAKWEKNRDKLVKREKGQETDRRQRRRHALRTGRAKPNPEWSKHGELFAALMDMLPLTNWRDRTQEWSPEQSDVNAWILDRLYDYTEYGEVPYMRKMPYANYISKEAKKGFYIVFDKETKLWSGWNVAYAQR